MVVVISIDTEEAWGSLVGDMSGDVFVGEKREAERRTGDGNGSDSYFLLRSRFGADDSLHLLLGNNRV